MTRIKGTFKDQGHAARKAVWLSFIVVTFPLGLIGLAGEWLLGIVSHTTNRLYRWSHPCLYRHDGKRGNNA